MATSPHEFAPLLAPGLHPMTLLQVKAMCVDAFPQSKTRKDIWNGLQFVLGRPNERGVEAEVWVDGSFLTEKPNPEDVDFVLCVRASVYDEGTEAVREALEWIKDDLKSLHKCDSHLFFVYERDDSVYEVGEKSRRYWLKQFGESRKDEPKGIAVVTLPSVKDRPSRKKA